MSKLNLLEYKNSLEHLAFKPENSLGRRFNVDQDSPYGNVLDPFLIDREKIRLSKSYRRLPHITQVLSPTIHHFVRNRSSHTNDVMNVASVVAHISGLNVYLSEAMASLHDVGQTPYGHSGEKYISLRTGKDFHHYVMSVIVAQFIERKGLGLNLTYETLLGALNHSRGPGQLFISKDSIQEEILVMYADKIAYTFSDLNDALRTEIVRRNNIPTFAYYFGENQRERVYRAIYELLKESKEVGSISFANGEAAEQFAKLRDWMFQNVYFKVNDIHEKKIFEKLDKCMDLLNGRFQTSQYLALCLMTDEEVNLVSSASLNGGFSKLPFLELFSPIFDSEIDIFNADLDPNLFKKEYL